MGGFELILSLAQQKVSSGMGEGQEEREREQAGRRKGKSSVNKWSVSRAREGSEKWGKG